MHIYRRRDWFLALFACAIAWCGKPAPMPTARSKPAASATHALPESPPASPARPVPESEPRQTESKAQDFSIQHDEHHRPGVALSTRVDGCALHLTLEKHRMWWRAARASDQPQAECQVLAPEHRAGWAALAEEANRLGILPERLVIIIDFHTDLPGIERWFRHQAASGELQRRARDRSQDRYIRMLAAELPGSGALFRYEELLQAIGLAIEKVSLEKVEVRAARDWQKHLPETKAWALPASSRLALPLLTRLDLRRADADAGGP